MNINVYATLYGRFHNCDVAAVQKNIIVLSLADLPWKAYYVERCYPSQNVVIDSKRPFLLALKSFYKSDVVTSVFNGDRDWTVLLGKERIVLPAAKEMATVHVYATPLFVQKPELISQYLEGAVRPAYNYVYMYKGTLLYLDPYDIPYPGGWYFNPGQTTGHGVYRMCFLTDKPIDYVSDLVNEWQARREILSFPYLTQETVSSVKWVDFQPVSGLDFLHSEMIAKGMIQKQLSEKHPHLLIQDILNSYDRNLSRYDGRHPGFTNLGVVMEWPFKLKYEGARSDLNLQDDKKYVALSINGNHPTHVIHVQFPYEFYQESHQVPATQWTSLYYTRFFVTTPVTVEKVVLESVVVGFVHQGVFFCLSYPLLEGRPSTSPVALHTSFLANTRKLSRPDSTIQIVETLAYNNQYSLHRARLQEIPYEVWCLTESDTMHPRPKRYHFPPLVKQWLELLAAVEGSPPMDIDTALIRTVLALAKHDICLELVPDSKKQAIRATNTTLSVYTQNEVVDFINDARVQRSKKTEEGETGCRIM